MLSGYLLEDTMVLILRRLPAESLVRFKAVSKPWCQLIECPRFITEHHRTRASINNDGCLLVKLLRHSQFSLLYNHSPTWRGLKHLHRSRDSDAFVALCNGIFCVFTGYHTVQLWNPAIRQYKTLPVSLLMPDHELPENFYCDYWNSVLGLNFNPICNGYKVVRIWIFRRLIRRPSLREDCMNKVEVWEPGHNSWRQIDDVPPIALDYYDNPINLKGRCYWLARGSDSKAIVSFDMAHEVFQTTPLPDALCVESIGCYDRMGISILNERIAVFSNPLYHSPECFEVWLMNGSEQGSWSKYMTVEMPTPGSVPIYWRGRYRKPEQPMMFPLTFWNNGELVFHDGFGRLVFLNTSTEKTVHSGLGINVLQQIYVYNESLVSINDWLK